MSYLLKDYTDLQYCLVDYTRHDEKWGSPKFLESLKDGIVQSNKYQSENIRFPNVQVAVMNLRLKKKKLTIKKTYDLKNHIFTVIVIQLKLRHCYQIKNYVIVTI